MTVTPAIIVGTGRCGSTLLSKMVSLHPEMVDISEVFSFTTDLGTRNQQAFPETAISAADFWKVVAEPQPRQNLLLEHGLQMEEVTFAPERSRFAAPNVPPIMQAMIPNLEPNDPDVLFDHLKTLVSKAPDQPGADHYRSMFEAVAAYHGKEVWVERSGGGLRLVERLRKCFPDALIIHLVRDGRPTALSMSRHIGFRMALLCGLLTECLGIDPFESKDRQDEDDLTDELANLLPERFSAQAFNEFDLPSSLCGHYWAGEIVAGLNALSDLNDEQLLTIKYEDLLADPVSVCSKVGEFVTGNAPQTWVDQAASLVESRPSAFSSLPADEQARLSKSCQPGFEALADAGIEWAEPS